MRISKFFSLRNFKISKINNEKLICYYIYIKKMTTRINVLQVIPNLAMEELKLVVTILPIIWLSKDVALTLLLQGGELLKFVKKNKVGII